MQYCQLGKSKVIVSRIGFGAGRIALPPPERCESDPADSEASRELITSAITLGCNHFDTADVYGYGASEALLGSILSNNTSDNHLSVITTKLGGNFYNIDIDPAKLETIRLEMGIEASELKYGYSLECEHGENFSSEYLRFALEKSRERLRRRTIDIVLLHLPPLSLLRMTNWDRTLQHFKEEGLCWLHGISVIHPIEILAALSHGSPDVIQVPVTMAISDPMKYALTFAKKQGISIIGREVFGQGGLMQHFAQMLRHDPQQWKGLTLGTLGRLLVSQVLSNGLVDACIVGCSSPQQVYENFREFDPSEVNQSIISRIASEVQRYAETLSPRIPRLHGLREN